MFEKLNKSLICGKSFVEFIARLVNLKNKVFVRLIQGQLSVQFNGWLFISCMLMSLRKGLFDVF